MLQELAAQTGAQIWAIASMLFFLLAFLVVTLLVWRLESEVANRCARLPLAGDGQTGPDLEYSPRARGSSEVTGSAVRHQPCDVKRRG